MHDPFSSSAKADTQPTLNGLLWLALAIALFVLILNLFRPAPIPAVSKIPASTISASAHKPLAPVINLAIAQRQGRCRALNYQLGRLSKAHDPSAAQSALKAMGLLAGEMMNGYLDAKPDPSSRAGAAVFSPGGQNELRDSRQAMLDNLRTLRGMDGKQAASRISTSCTACHSRFVREGGRELVLLAQ